VVTSPVPEQELPRRPAPAAKKPCPGGGGTGGEPCCAACGPLVDDGAATEAGQLPVGAFLDRLRAELAAAIDTELADLGLSSRDCPYLDSSIDRYRSRPATELTAVVQRYAQPASLTPDGMIAAIRARVVQGARAYRDRAAPAPSAAPTKLVAGAGTAAAPGPADTARLGPGAPMPGGLRGRMERSYGTGLGHLRVHAGAEGAEVADRFGARAVTFGGHLAFATGELDRPGPERDVLVAHEVAHSLQQRDSGGGPMEGTAALSPAYERDADRSAALVAIRTMLGEDAAVAPAPQLRGGLGLGRCAVAAAPAVGAAGGTGLGIGLADILGAIGLGAIMTLESDTPKVEEEEQARTCETVYPGVRECWTLPDDYVFPGAGPALAAMKAAENNPSLVLHGAAPTTSGPCPGQGTHYNVRDGSTRVGSITCCPCCSDDPGGPVLTERCRIVW
jgi:hypothetical protein